MRIVFAASLLSILAIATSACRKPEPEPPVPQRGSDAKPPPKDAGQGGIVRAKQRQEIQNDLGNIAKWYIQEALTNAQDKGPAKLDTLLATIKSQQRGIFDAIENGSYVVVKSAPLTSSAIVAYERQADQSGQHVVAFGDGSIRNIPSEELDAQLKKQGAPPRK